MKTVNSYRFSLLLGVVALIATTLFFIIRFQKPNADTLLISLISSGLAIVFAIIGIALSLNLRKKGKKQSSDKLKKASKRSFILNLFALLLSIFWIWAALSLLDYDRIILYNQSGVDIGKIEFHGAGTAIAEDIKKGEKKCVWVKLSNEQALIMNYKINKKNISDTVKAYTGPLQGEKYEFIITAE